MIRNFGIASEIEFDPIDGFDGYIDDNNLEDTPYFDPGLEFPRYFKAILPSDWSGHKQISPCGYMDARANIELVFLCQR